MRKITGLSSLTIIIFMLTSCSANKKLADSNTVILPLSDTVKIMEGGILYSLPRTVFTLYAEIERTIEKPGPYAQFAGEMLGLSGVIQSENESWTITGLRLETHEEIDPSEYYVIESNSLFQSNVLSLKKEGLILDINPDMFYSGDRAVNLKSAGSDQFSYYDLGSDEYFQMQRDTAYRRVAVDSAFIRVPYIVEKKKRLTVEQMAERAARRLMEMREGKHLILTGEATVFPQNDAAINEMNRLEKEYTELFTGKTWKETSTYSFQIIPDKEMIGKPVVLTMISEERGPVDKSETTGKPLSIEFKPEQKTKDLTIISKKQSDPDAPVYDKLYYRIPDVANVIITSGDDILFNSRRLIYQFGEIVQLPANYIIGK